MARGAIRAANITGSGPQIETWVLGSGIHVPLSALRAFNDAGTDLVDLKATAGGLLRVSVDNNVAIAEPVDVNVVSGGGGGIGDNVDVNNFPAVQPVSDNGASLTVDGPVTDAQLRASAVNVVQRFTGGSHARKTHTTANTPEQLTTSSTPCLGVKIIAYPNNAGRIMVGLDSSVRASDAGFEGLESLYAEDSALFGIDNANKIWIDAEVSGEGFTWGVIT